MPDNSPYSAKSNELLSQSLKLCEDLLMKNELILQETPVSISSQAKVIEEEIYTRHLHITLKNTDLAIDTFP